MYIVVYKKFLMETILHLKKKYLLNILNNWLNSLKCKIQIQLIYTFYQGCVYVNKELWSRIKMLCMNFFIKMIWKRIKKIKIEIVFKEKYNSHQDKTLLQIINLNSDKIKGKCKYYQKYHHFLHLHNLEHYHNFMKNVKCLQMKV